MVLARTPVFTPLAAVTTLPAVTGEARNGAGRMARDDRARRHAGLRARQDAGEGGLVLVAAYTDAVDHLVRFLSAEAAASYASRYARINQRCAVVGLGGYGRGELNPASDIDLLFVYPWKVNPYVETIAEVILYALWDAGLTVGHALRNIRECGRLAARELKVKTALLDARYLVGDEVLYAEFEAKMFEEVWGQNPTAFFKEKLAENTERHARAGDSVYLLQPQLKEGQGGLRDLHTALWMAKVKFKVRSFRELVTLGQIAERDVLELEEALDFLWRIRNALHQASDRHQDLLTFELQERLAPALGFPDERDGVEAFMRVYYGRAAVVNRFSEAVIARCVQAEPYRRSAPAVRVIRPGIRIQGRTLSVVNRGVFERDPAAVVQVFADAQRHGVTLAPATRDLIREGLPLLAAHRERPEVSAAFLGILRAKGHVDETLFEMHKLGVLKTVIPEFGHLDCLIAHDPFHIYTVDHHSLRGARELHRLYLLTYADMRAVGPGVWSTWRDTLVTELYVRAREFFAKGVFEAEDPAARAARLQGRVRETAPPAAIPSLDLLFRTMPDSYFLSTPEETIVAHAELRAQFGEREAARERPAVATQLGHFPEREYTEFAVCTRDRAGLFAMLSGVLAAHGLNILAARITTSRDGVALDVFRISHEGSDIALDAERWERVEHALRGVLGGEIDVEALVERSRRPSRFARPRRQVPTRVEIDNTVSREHTVLDVFTADRVGLLFSITNCLYHLWLEIHLAKITTMVDQVLDVFYVTDHQGRKIEDAARLEAIREALARALEIDGTAAAAQAAGG